MHSKFIHQAQSTKTSEAAARIFRFEKQSSLRQKLKSNETDNDAVSRRDRAIKSVTILQEITIMANNSSNSKKLLKLVSSFMSQEQQLQQITEQLDKTQIVTLFLNIHLFQMPQLVQFLHLLYDCLLQLDTQFLDVFKYILLLNYELYQGQAGQLTRILEILSEMQVLNPDFSAFENEFQFDIEDISNSFNRVQLRILFLASSIDILHALKGSVSLFEQLESFVFSSIKKNEIPNINDLQTLVIAYILLSEQLDISNKLGYAKQALEIIGKNPDYSIFELKKRFIMNATKLSQKYLGQQVYDQLLSINRSFSPGFTRQSLTHLTPKDNQFFKFLVSQLKITYAIDNDLNFQIDSKCNSLLTEPLINQLLDRVIPQAIKKEKVNSTFTEQSQQDKKPIIIKKQFSIKQLKQENIISSQVQVLQINFQLLLFSLYFQLYYIIQEEIGNEQIQALSANFLPELSNQWLLDHPGIIYNFLQCLI